MITNATIYPMHGPRGGHNPSAPQRHPRVLTDSVLGRLARLNNVVRRLREWGLGIAEQRVDGPRGAPYVRITRAPQVSIAPLLDATQHRNWLRVSPRPACLHAELDGVNIEWEAE